MEDYCLNEFFDIHAKKIRIYLAIETIDDPFEKNVSLTQLNPLSIKAIISDLTATQASYKMIGISVTKAKEIIIKKKYRSLIEQSQFIEINKELFEGWKVSGRMQIREEGDFLRIYVYIKKV